MNSEKLKRFLPYIIITASFLVALMILFFLMDWLVMPYLVHSGDTVKVPDVVGKNYEQAVSEIEGYKLKVQKTGEQFSSKFPKNAIINQVPKPGIDVKAGRTIFVSVSKGIESANVPYLIGKPLRDARMQLYQRGLQLGEVKYVYCDSVGADTILSQNLFSGKDIPSGGLINVVVSKGAESQIMVPNLIGLTLPEAQSSLIESGLVLGNIVWGKSETYLPNTVIRQTPQNGVLVPKKSSVAVEVAK